MCLYTCTYALIPRRHGSQLTSLQLILSLAWHNLDLTSRRLFRQDLPAVVLICMDLVGFLGFLAILIANGIIAEDLSYHGGLIVMLAYNSVFWIICW